MNKTLKLFLSPPNWRRFLFFVGKIQLEEKQKSTFSNPRKGTEIYSNITNYSLHITHCSAHYTLLIALFSPLSTIPATSEPA
jgi:hypothetical protein